MSNPLTPEQKDLLKTLQIIQDKYKYSTSEKIIAHYLERIFPDPASLIDDDLEYYIEFSSSLKILLMEHEIKKPFLYYSIAITELK